MGTLVALVSVLLFTGCASGPQADPRDPLEPINRTVYRFNDAVDRAAIKPVATAYQDTVPVFARTSVSNFFHNLGDVWSFFNTLMQGRSVESAQTFMRVNVNTVFGIAGLFDVASEMGIERTRADFGQTLGRWGVDSGPYLVLPLLGPSTLRDTAGLVVDAQGDAVGQGVEDVATRNSLQVLRVVDTRAGLLQAGDLLDDIALDPYTFVRDAYLQRRQSLIDGPQVEERYDLE